MEEKKKAGRYKRIYNQLGELILKSNNTQARMATVIAVLHHKMDYFFWTGYYLISEGEMTVNTYQGPVACQILDKGNGVCWAAFNKKETIIVDDVQSFPNHIACDSRSKSEIVVPFKNKEGEVIGVLDVDSDRHASFSETDARWLEKILKLIWMEKPVSSG